MEKATRAAQEWEPFVNEAVTVRWSVGGQVREAPARVVDFLPKEALGRPYKVRFEPPLPGARGGYFRAEDLRPRPRRGPRTQGEADEGKGGEA